MDYIPMNDFIIYIPDEDEFYTREGRKYPRRLIPDEWIERMRKESSHAE